MKKQFPTLFSKVIFSLFIFYFILFSTNCSKDSVDSCIGNFSQEAMFENVTNRIVLPAYLDLQLKVNNLRQKAIVFDQEPDESNLSTMQAAFAAAWISWQAAAPFQFGPAETVNLRVSLNSFPCDITQINQNITNKNYNLEASANTFAKGFAGLDYLLYGLEADEEALVASLSQLNQMLYLFDLIEDIKFRVDFVLEEWEDNNYSSEFIKNTGTHSGSSLSLLLEGFYNNYALIKEEKLGIPSGITTTGMIAPQKVEALYSGLSLELTSAAIIAMEKTFKGGNGDGLDDYLVSRKAKKGDRPLNLLIEDAFEVAKTSVQKINGPLSQALEQDFPTIQEAYLELQKLEKNIQEELPSALCVNL